MKRCYECDRELIQSGPGVRPKKGQAVYGGSIYRIPYCDGCLDRLDGCSPTAPGNGRYVAEDTSNYQAVAIRDLEDSLSTLGDQ